eukprot:TRINITY_DN75_c4_g2_i3.p1 TRINITY_DN75_c4_g2~~TRINITY_DN75_c4_g2_i3.p1  ORF type:complete len:1301 (-),score=228.88 TRINITY_DN75_c4_g2_i3:392-4294(-)
MTVDPDQAFENYTRSLLADAISGNGGGGGGCGVGDSGSRKIPTRESPRVTVADTNDADAGKVAFELKSPKGDRSEKVDEDKPWLAWLYSYPLFVVPRQSPETPHTTATTTTTTSTTTPPATPHNKSGSVIMTPRDVMAASRLVRIWKKQAKKVNKDESLSPELRTEKLAALIELVACWFRTFPRDWNTRQMASVLPYVKADATLTNEMKLRMLRTTQGGSGSFSSLPVRLQSPGATTPTTSVSAPTTPQQRSSDSPVMTYSKSSSMSVGGGDSPANSRNGKRYSGFYAESPLRSYIDFVDLHESVLARELTVLEWDLFSQVDVRNLMTMTNKEQESKFALIPHYNHIANWVATEILITKGSSTQVRVIEKFIRLALHLLHLNNFNGAMEIISGLNHSTIQRLKRVWAMLPRKMRDIWNNFDELMNPRQNFAIYRKQLEKRRKNSVPLLPYFGLYMRDFTFINDGNPKYNPEGTINEAYVQLLYQRAKEIKICQSVPYVLSESDRSASAQSYFASLPSQIVEDEDALYAMSLQIQPSLWVDPARPEEEADSDSTKSEILFQVQLRSGSGGYSASEPDPWDDSESKDTYSSDTEESCEQIDKRSRSNSVGRDSVPSSSLLKSASIEYASPREESKKPSRQAKLKTKFTLPTLNLLTAAGSESSTAEPLAFGGTIIREKRAVVRRVKSERKNKELHVEIIKVTKTLNQCNSVRVPPQFEPLFFASERIVHRYFSECVVSVPTGVISIFDERYLMLRASSLSVDFFDAIAEAFESGGIAMGFSEKERFAQRLLFDFAHAVGMSDARNFMKKMNLSFGPEGLSAGPPYAAYTGWAGVRMHDGCRPVPNDDCYLLFDHPFSFESDAWMLPENKHQKPQHPVCVMSAGYSSGWAGESMGHVDLVGAEVMCTALGDPSCRFIMAHPTKIHAHLEKFFDDNNFSWEKRKSVVVHQFLASRNMFEQVIDPDNSSAQPSSLRKPTANTASKKKPGSRRRAKIFGSIVSKWRRGSVVGGSVQLPNKSSSSGAGSQQTQAQVQPATTVDTSKQEASPELRNLISNDTKNNNRTIHARFRNRILDPRKAQVSICGQRHLFIRGEAISFEFFNLLQEMFPPEQRDDARLFAAQFAFDMARNIGKSDMRFYSKALFPQKDKSVPFAERFLCLPPIMAHTGWGVMKLVTKTASFNTDDSSARPFYLKFTIANGVEAQVWMKKEQSHNSTPTYARPPVCSMSAGYVTGFVNECARKTHKEVIAKLAVVEVACEALGHGQRCTFLMSSEEHITGHVKEYLARHKCPQFISHLNVPAADN